MLKIIKKSPLKRNLLIVLAVSLVVLSGVTGVAVVKNIGPFAEKTSQPGGINYKEPTDAQVEAGVDIKEDAIPPESTDSPSTPQTKPGQADAQDTTSGKVGVEITAGPNVQDDVLEVRTLVQEINSSGICTLTLSKSGQPSITRTAKTQVSGSVSTCQGFTINVGSLAKGSWLLTINYKSDKSRGSVRESITL